MGPITISNRDFKDLIAGRTDRYFKAVAFLANFCDNKGLLTRPLLGELLSQSAQVEEFLDSYGARNNCQWARFRSLTAAVKLFSNVSYELLHIQHSIPVYRLLGVKDEFSICTKQTLEFTKDVLIATSKQLLKEAIRLKLPLPIESQDESFFEEKLPEGRLSHDLAMRKVENVSNTVTMLATAFLNLSAKSHKFFNRSSSSNSPDGFNIAISEEKARSLELRFHNLQSLYDTYVSITQAEVLDDDLPVLRGHISVVLHLLRTARDFAHYYERHASCPRHTTPELHDPAHKPQNHDKSLHHKITKNNNRLVDPEHLLCTLTNYCAFFVNEFLDHAEQLCRNMLKRYTEVGSVEVLVPPYRGFHVRPSTLISKLVLHYGSEVKMLLSEDVYDARSPLELFRANEKINAHKRRSLAQEIFKLNLISSNVDGRDIESVIRNIVVELADSGKVIIYEHPLKFDGIDCQPNARVVEQISDAIARLLVTGKIDIVTSIKAVFRGDKRVLQDIALLAENGYGEDNHGNNISLPESLAFLR